MRFPKLTELDKEQTRIYQGAPTTGTILVMGPPGTGKTVIAFHRAHTLQKLGQLPDVVMYNKVLRQYTSHRRGVAPDVEVSTFHSWAASWWRKATGQFHVPSIPGNKYDHDWDEIQKALVAKLASGAHPSRMHFGHVIIDEGQDLPRKMYATLRTIMTLANAKGAEPPLAMTVLADENQRLQAERNSTLEQIRQSLGLHGDDKNVFALLKNYRNTLEIAKFAACFYVGLKSGIPELPTLRRGSIPVISTSGKETEGQNLNAFVERIARHAKNRPTEEIGVLVANNNKVRSSLVNRLKHRLGRTDIKVQTYESGNDDALAEDLDFDEPGHVTVLNLASAKGLEFDSVFVIDPGKLLSGGASEIGAKMALYVMCSRARAYLEVMLVEDAAIETILSWIPNKDLYHLEKL